MVELATIHDILIKAINDDPDLQVKTLIASQLARRDSLTIIQKLVGLSKSTHPEVREIVAMSLDGHFEVFNDILNWFEYETDRATLNKLFITLSSTLRKVSENIDTYNTAIRLSRLAKQKKYLHYCLELIGYCTGDIVSKTFLDVLYTYRFNDKTRSSALRGIFNLAQKNHSLQDDIQNYLFSLVAATYEQNELREIGLDALGQIKNQEVIDLLEILIETDHNPNLRKKAIELVGNWGVIELSPLLIERLKYDGHFEVRASAAIALGEMASFDVLPELSDALEKDTSFFVREASAEALGKIKSQQAISVLLKGLEDHDSYVRSTSAWSIEQLQPDSKTIINRICSAARSIEQDLNVRSGMVKLLARMKSMPEAVDCLLTIFKEDKSPLRELVLESLEEFNQILRDDKKFLAYDLPIFQSTLISSQSFSLRASICSFFGHLQVDTTFPFLLDRLLNDEDAFVQRQAAWAISSLSPDDHIADIRKLLEEKVHEKIIPLLFEILTAWANLADVHLALKYLKTDQDIEIRRSVVEFLTAIIDSPSLVTNEYYTNIILNTLIHMLQEDDANIVRSACAHALGHFEGFDNQISPALIQAIKNDRVYTVRELSAEALGYRGGVSIIPELINLVQHDIEKDPSIRYFSSLALLNIEIQIAKKMKK